MLTFSITHFAIYLFLSIHTQHTNHATPSLCLSTLFSTFSPCTGWNFTEKRFIILNLQTPVVTHEHSLSTIIHSPGKLPQHKELGLCIQFNPLNSQLCPLHTAHTFNSILYTQSKLIYYTCTYFFQPPMNLINFAFFQKFHSPSFHHFKSFHFHPQASFQGINK